jgi:hypothetical protein
VSRSLDADFNTSTASIRSDLPAPFGSSRTFNDCNGIDPVRSSNEISLYARNAVDSSSLLPTQTYPISRLLPLMTGQADVHAARGSPEKIFLPTKKTFPIIDQVPFPTPSASKISIYNQYTSKFLRANDAIVFPGVILACLRAQCAA